MWFDSSLLMLHNYRTTEKKHLRSNTKNPNIELRLKREQMIGNNPDPTSGSHGKWKGGIYFLLFRGEF